CDVKLTCDRLLALGYPHGPGPRLLVLGGQRGLPRGLGMRGRPRERYQARERPGKHAAETDSDHTLHLQGYATTSITHASTRSSKINTVQRRCQATSP